MFFYVAVIFLSLTARGVNACVPSVVFLASLVLSLRSFYRRPNNPLEIWDYGTAELKETIPWNRSSAQVNILWNKSRRVYPGNRKEECDRQQTLCLYHPCVLPLSSRCRACIALYGYYRVESAATAYLGKASGKLLTHFTGLVSQSSPTLNRVGHTYTCVLSTSTATGDHKPVCRFASACVHVFVCVQNVQPTLLYTAQFSNTADGGRYIAAGGSGANEAKVQTRGDGHNSPPPSLPTLKYTAPRGCDDAINTCA